MQLPFAYAALIDLNFINSFGLKEILHNLLHNSRGVIKRYSIEVIQKNVSHLLGRGFAKKITMCDIGGRNPEPKSDVTPSKNIFLLIVLELI